MRLLSLDIFSAPGFRKEQITALQLKSLEQGVILLVGPNGSGKSTICNTVLSHLSAQEDNGVHASTLWQFKEQEVEVTSFTGIINASQQLNFPAELKGVCRFVLKDLLESADSDNDIANEIQKALDGNLDLSALETVKARNKPPNKLTEAHKGLQQKIRDYDRRVNESAIQQRELQGIEEELSSGNETEQELKKINAKLKLIPLVAQLKPLKLALQDFPEYLESIPDNAVREAEKLHNNWLEDKISHDDKERELIDEEAVLAELAFPESVGLPSEALLNGCEFKAEKLKSLSSKLDQLKCDQVTKSKAYQDALFLIWKRTEDYSGHLLTEEQLKCKALPDRESIERLRSLQNNRTTLKQAIEALKISSIETNVLLSTEQLNERRQALNILDNWLKSPNDTHDLVHTLDVASQLANWPIGLGLGLLIVAVICWLLGQMELAVLLLSLATAFIGAWVSAWRAAKSKPASKKDYLSSSAFSSDHYQREYRQHNFSEEPASWNLEDVRHFRDKIQSELNYDDLERKRTDVSKRHDKNLKHVLKQLEECNEELQKVTQQLDLSPDLVDLELIQQAARLTEFVVARQIYFDVIGQLEGVFKQINELIKEVRQLLSSIGVDAGEIESATDASFKVEELQTQRRNFITSKECCQKLRRELDERARIVERSQASFMDFLKLCKVSSEDFSLDIHARLTEKKKREDTLEKIRRLDLQIDELEKEVTLDGSEDVQTLESEREALDAKLKRRENLIEEKAEINLKINSLEDDQSRAKLCRQERSQLEKLAEDRNLELENRAYLTLLDWLRKDRANNHESALLTNAQRWFHAFTHNRYTLSVKNERTNKKSVTRFVAYDHELGQEQLLDHLSDGTRIQLLLAARLAFIESVEDDIRFPLIFDEILATTDPVRFRAIASVVFELVRQGRQVFYTTSSDAQVEEWRQAAKEAQVPAPQVCKLSEQTLRDWKVPLQRAPTTPPPIDGHDVITWCKAAQYEQPNVFTKVDQWPLAICFFDELEVVHKLATEHYRYVSHLGDLGHLAGESQIQKAQERKVVFERIISELRVGRTKPITLEGLGEWKQVGKYRSDLASLIDNCGDQPRQFLQAVGDLKGVGKKSIEQLEEVLTDQQMLDERVRYSFEEIFRKCREYSTDYSAEELEHKINLCCQLVGVEIEREALN